MDFKNKLEYFQLSFWTSSFNILLAQDTCIEGHSHTPGML